MSRHGRIYVITLILFHFFYSVGYRVKRTTLNPKTLTCLDCKHLVQPYDCNTVTECGSHEECYTDRQVTDDGHIYFNVGCRSKSKCSAVLPIGKRNTNLCLQCCDSDLCNVHSQCGSKEPPIRVGQQYCFACPNGRPTSSDCNTIKLCEDDQLCYLKRSQNRFGETRWITGCKEFSIFTWIQKCINGRSNYCTDQCCSTDLCNQKCNSTAMPPTIPTTTPTPVKQTTSDTQRHTPIHTTYDPYCVDVGQYCHDWAAKGECTNNPGYMLVSCKKSCNNCGSTGTCIDTNISCHLWAQNGYCSRYPQNMHECKKSCNKC